MPRVAGYNATITFAFSPDIVLYVNANEGSRNVNALDVSAYGDGQDDVFIAGTRSGEISCEGFLNSTAAIPAPGAANATIVYTPTAGQTRTCSGFWKQLTESIKRNDSNRIRGTFQCSGAWVNVP